MRSYTRERILLPLSASDCRDAFTRYILQTAIICVCEYNTISRREAYEEKYMIIDPLLASFAVSSTYME